MGLLNELTTGQWGANKKGPLSLQGYPGPDQMLAGFTPGQLEGLALQYGAVPGQMGVTGAAAGQAGDILSGKYLNPQSNQYLQNYYQAALQPMSQAYQATTAPGAIGGAEAAGAFGGSADVENRALNQYNFGNQAQNLAANIYEPAYQQGLDQITKTLALSPSIASALNIPGETALAAGGLQQTQAQNELNTAYGNAYQRAMWPYQELGFLGGGLTGLLPAGGSSTSRYPNPYANAGAGTFAGLGLGGLGLAGELFPNQFAGAGNWLAGLFGLGG